MAYRGNQQEYPPYQYNPYANDQPHQSYEQGGYNTENGGYGNGYSNGAYRDEPLGAGKERDRAVAYEDAFPNRPAGPKTTSNMRRWRYERHNDLWTRGGGARIIGRFFCCTVMIGVFLALSIILSLALWVRPPSISLGDITLNDTTPDSYANETIYIYLDTNVSVNNPNYFSVDLTDLTIDFTYPDTNVSVGSVHKSDIDFGSDAQTNFTLPVTLTLNISDTSEITTVIEDIATKCGFLGGSSSDLTVDYNATVGIKVLSVPIKPSFSSSISFACPLTESDLEEYLSDAGLSLSDIIGSLL